MIGGADTQLFEWDLKTRINIYANSRPEDIAALQRAYEVSGWRGYWTTDLSLRKKGAWDAFGDSRDLASIYARIGEKDQAFFWLERAYQERSQWLTFLKVEPVWDSLRSDPRFTDLLRRVGLAS